MKNDNLQNLILSAAKRGYAIRFRMPFMYCGYLAIRVETELPNGTFVCKDRYIHLSDIEESNLDIFCIAIKEMLEEFEKIWEEQNNG